MNKASDQGKLLVVQASPKHRGVNLSALERAGYQLRIIADEKAKPQDVKKSTRAVLLDGLDEPGWRFLRSTLEEQPNLPVIVSSNGLETRAIIGLLDIGVDAHTDPSTSTQELIARIAWARRRAERPDVDNGPSLEIDDTQRRIWLNGAPLDLPRREFDVLAVLMMNVGNIITRDRLMQAVWGPGYKTGSRSLDVRVSRIRKLLRDEGGEEAPLVETVPGVGYRLVM